MGEGPENQLRERWNGGRGEVQTDATVLVLALQQTHQSRNDLSFIATTQLHGGTLAYHR